jgi:hypothetical protein
MGYPPQVHGAWAVVYAIQGPKRVQKACWGQMSGTSCVLKGMESSCGSMYGYVVAIHLLGRHDSYLLMWPTGIHAIPCGGGLGRASALH